MHHFPLPFPLILTSPLQTPHVLHLLSNSWPLFIPVVTHVCVYIYICKCNWLTLVLLLCVWHTYIQTYICMVNNIALWFVVSNHLLLLLIDFSVLLVEWCVLYRLLGFLEHLVVVIVSLSSYPLCPLSTPLLSLAHMYIGLTMDPKLLTKCSLYFSIYFNFFLSQFKV